MQYILFMIWLIAIVAIIVGMIRPNAVIRWGNKRTRKKVLLIYGIAWFSSLIIFGMIAPSEEEKNKAKTIADFQKDRAEIIENAEIALIEKRYKDLISETQEYIIVGDSVLNRLRIAARTEMKKQSDVARSEEILTELKNIPAKDYERNTVLYKELSELSPGNSMYKEKFKYYSDMHNQEQAKLKAKRDSIRSEEILAELKNVPATDYARNLDLYYELIKLKPNNQEYKKMYKQIQEWQEYDRLEAEKFEREQKAVAEKYALEQESAAKKKEKIETQFSAWDGSHHNLERLIKQNMNDPDSYKHVETVYWDMGTHLVVRTTFRGKNAFGAMVINYIKAKVDLDGNIIEIMEQGP